MTTQDIIFAIAVIIGFYLMTIVVFCNLLDDCDLHKDRKKIWFIQLFKNTLLLLLLLFFSTVLTVLFIKDVKNPRCKVETLKNRAESAQKALDDYLNKHPEFKEE